MDKFECGHDVQEARIDRQTDRLNFMQVQVMDYEHIYKNCTKYKNCKALRLPCVWNLDIDITHQWALLRLNQGINRPCVKKGMTCDCQQVG